MKFVSLAAATFALALSAFAQAETLSYDTTYDNPNLSLASVRCSDGTHGLLSKGFTTLGSLPTFPHVGGVYTVTSWNSPACGTCYSVTYNGKSIYVLAVDGAADGFNLSEEAMNELTGGLAVELGRVPVTSVQVDPFFCGLW